VAILFLYLLSPGIATGKTHNAGHNCLAAELIITAADWPQREEFLDIFR